MTRASSRLVVLLVACLFPPGASGQEAAVPVPPAPPADHRALEVDEAARVAGTILGARVDDPSDDGQRFVFDARGFRDKRTCPLDGVRDVRCGPFTWSPSRVAVYRQVLAGAVSGHLARNLVVRVELTSDDAGVAFGTLHGVLVFPGPSVGPSDRPAFAWYVGREARVLAAGLLDVNRDGALDLLYTYVQRLPGGRRVVARDVWTFTALQAEKLISSGEKLSGLGTSTFDGVPLHEDGPDGAVRGAFRFEDLAPGLPLAGVFERARLAGVRSGWDLRVVADLGDGWREILSGVGPQAGVPEGASEAACRPLDVPAEADMEVRRRLLDLETACRIAMDATPDDRPEPWRAPLRLKAALRLDVVGLPMAALGLRERAANDLALASPRAWFVAALLSLSAALPADRALADALGPGSAAQRFDALDAFPVLWPLTIPMNAALGLVRTLVAWW